MDPNTILDFSGNGTAMVPTIPGRKYVLFFSGDFNDGNITFGAEHSLVPGSWAAYDQATTNANKSFVATADRLVFVLSGATEPNVSVVINMVPLGA